MLTSGRNPRATRTASTTSAVPAHRAMTAGRRSISPFHTWRASSYAGCSRSMTSPRSAALSAPAIA
jgi:hypothetical protein